MNTTSNWPKFWATLAIIIAVVLVYAGITRMFGGLEALFNAVFGGFAGSATTIAVLVLVIAAFYWFYWSDQHPGKSRGTSAGRAAVGVALLIAAAIIGFAWVNWTWGLFWLVPLALPAVAGALMIVLWLMPPPQAPVPELD